MPCCFGSLLSLLFISDSTIETLFGSLKSKGFNLEDTHMTASAKIDRLMSVLAIGFVLSCRAGKAEDKRRPIR